MPTIHSLRDKSILAGLFLSKFDKEGVHALGFETINEAFNTLGYAIGAKPNSIKNYRDEFDPYFPNERKGWHKRQIRSYCKQILDEFTSLSFSAYVELIKSLIFPNYELEKFIQSIEKKDKSESVVKRLITGKAAEEYFKLNHGLISDFNNHLLLDATNLACGFDFKLESNLNFYCVEVKGLNTLTGNISLTEKEFNVAGDLKEKYCLFIVSNFIDKPIHQCIFDPLNSRLKFKKIERQVVQINYNTLI